MTIYSEKLYTSSVIVSGFISRFIELFLVYQKIWSNKKKWKTLAVPKSIKVDSGNKAGGYTEEVKALVCQCAEWMCVLSVVYIPICIAAQYAFTSTLFIPLLKMNLYPRYSFGQLFDSTDVGFRIKKAYNCYWKEAFQVEEVN